MRKQVITIIVVLLILALAGCSKNMTVPDKGQPGTEQRLQGKTNKDNPAEKTAKHTSGNQNSSEHLSEIKITLDNLNEVIKDLDDVNSEELTIPAL